LPADVPGDAPGWFGANPIEGGEAFLHSRPGHHHHTEGSALPFALAATLLILVVEVVFGVLANSLALVSDAGHVLTDVIALGLAWFALRRSARPPDTHYTFGYGRSGILAALANAILLIVIALLIGVTAFVRVQNPPHVTGVIVVLAALFGAGVNVAVASRLRAQSQGDINVRAALLHVLGDIAASVAVAVSGIIILFTHLYVVDPLMSWIVAVLIAFGAWRIVTEATRILMEATPPGLDLPTIAHSMREVPGVEEVHDLHVWSLSDGFLVLSAHVITPDQQLSSAANLLSDLRLLLSRRFGIQHSTIEIECEACTTPTSRTITMQETGPTLSR
jgi:cobalt-zinc-cadmium efflux system protein